MGIYQQDGNPHHSAPDSPKPSFQLVEVGLLNHESPIGRRLNQVNNDYVTATTNQQKRLHLKNSSRAEAAG